MTFELGHTKMELIWSSFISKVVKGQKVLIELQEDYLCYLSHGKYMKYVVFADIFDHLLQ